MGIELISYGGLYLVCFPRGDVLIHLPHTEDPHRPGTLLHTVEAAGTDSTESTFDRAMEYADAYIDHHT